MTRPDRGGWTLERAGNLQVARCAALESSETFVHAFSTRDAGDAEAARRLLAAAGLAGWDLILLRQVHGSRLVSALEAGKEPEADGILLGRDSAGLAAGIRTADCVPALLVDAAGGLGAAVHAGWRGAAAGIVVKAVSALEAAGASPDSLTVALGPAIGACCYRVGPEVARALRGFGCKKTAGGVVFLDLREALRRQLEQAGVPGTRIHSAPWCTRCRPDLFHSYRRDGEKAGRMLTVLARASGSP